MAHDFDGIADIVMEWLILTPVFLGFKKTFNQKNVNLMFNNYQSFSSNKCKIKEMVRVVNVNLKNVW